MRSFEANIPQHESFKIVGPGSDEFRQGVTVVVPFSQEDLIRSEPGMDKAGVFNEDAGRRRMISGRVSVFLAGLQDGAAPFARGGCAVSFALRSRARASIGQQHEAGCIERRG